MRAAALAVVLVLAGAGCSSDGDEVETTAGGSGAGAVGTLAQIGERLAFELTADPDPPTSGAPMAWSVIVRNVSATSVRVTFPDARQADVALRRDGAEVYRWSDDRVFTQAVTGWTLGPDEERRVHLDEPSLDVEPGDYELVAELRSDPPVEPATKQVTVSPPED